MTAELESVSISVEDDNTADVPHLGRYSNEPGPEDRTVDRKERGDRRPGEKRYFIATHSPEDAGNPESVEQDYERMEALNRGEWRMVGIRAVAVIEASGSRQTIKSTGLWGIPSDADREYHVEVASEQLGELGEILEDMGIDTPDEFNVPFAGV